MTKLNWYHDDGWFAEENGFYYGVTIANNQYAAFVNSDLYMGGYLNDELNIICGFGVACARGLHPDTICLSEQAAKDRCEQHYLRAQNNLSKLIT